MLLRFTKMHGLGNDFLMLDLISQNLQIRDDRIRCLADRHLGIGFDQVLMVEPPQDPQMDFRFRIFNADGSEAEQCGNGARCFTRFVRDRGLTTKTELKLETIKGMVKCKLQKDGNITVNMGPPRLQPDCIPFSAPRTQITYNLQLADGLCADETDIEISAVSMGNPHAVLLVENVDTAPVKTLGPRLAAHGRFPQGVNVSFMEVVDRKNIRLRVYERGSGETRACGSGACAAVVTGRLQGLLEEEVNVQLPGGTLRIEWQGDDSPVLQTGPACRVYEGHLLI
ncbi:MAG: diaminopimelate epimerase [Pseudomonadales bacterium]|nr:diaminopimelate epimerase [Pseudomonadales bacterium]MDP7146201.1 diaminopimelate epimerase [Pseudomonadales bacterium]MDP7360538.1 diaminopimelate epimerase [Pseudomonadales bacterium]MDP7598009.1 diaminopimelate epimerase [Pseudomonadales bacterium]HJN49358.1 diaminopimelate epimerase [Pseudomonadales bacterium]